VSELNVLLAMHRTGQHAVINWLCKQHGDITHYNNPYLNEDQTEWLARRPDIGEIKYGDGEDAIINLESKLPTDWEDNGWGTIPATTKYDSVKQILVIRRFRNWIASTAMHKGNKCLHDNTADTQSWKKWYHRLGCYRQHLDTALHAAERYPDLTVIRFDDWFSNKEYREAICANLGLTFTDAGLNDVPRFANGSTFDQRKYDGTAQKMGVLDRWKSAEHTKLYRYTMRSNPFTAAASEEYFNTEPKL
jgi:hypothetical protein